MATDDKTVDGLLINRREAVLAGGAALAALGSDATAQDARTGPLKVAILIDHGATLIDFAGLWQALGDCRADPGFDVYTVAPRLGPIRTYGSLLVSANHTYETAPQPDILFMGAQSGGRTGSTPAKIAWIRATHAKTRLTASACTGSFILAQAGLLDGLQATTHHDYLEDFRTRYPKVNVVANRRVIPPQQRIVTAGGESCSLDLGLWLVKHFCGLEAAGATATYMEYQGDAWRT
jgi:transcriptional regulator GlxA family with amidase domain